MRAIVYGVGAIGGAVATALSKNGIEVIGIARGAQLDAIRENGLRMRSPDFDERVRFDCVSDPAEIDFREDDAILLCMKTQDTEAALERLRAAGVVEQPIFCLQNGVENERIALRRFPNVHALCVMLPASFLEPGEVVGWCAPRFGMFDFGRYPSGHDAADEALAKAFEGSMIEPFVADDAMASKYGKLLMNLSNILQAALGREVDYKDLSERLKAEAIAVYEAAGIAWKDVSAADPRRDALMKTGEVPDVPRVGGSTAQSLARGAGSVETDYLNGEISLLGRLHGVATPLNDAMTRLGARLARDGAAPASLERAELDALIAG
ncbi:ketopantoate reductase family protein [Thalassovita mangrovi]|uniref:2-dehydropantoate 2-reductase n=1 Tax=Thalassovita mangrovi TaxID=2692236 RepID=A0A6L8LGT7_9RHOB|nr:2-dehydropantoate 2-reductase N-terminal domain-containing protein [Thalassovita mangrovi]MYM55327.1 ketopantoate reductase family protein [Thalassovita mangrovi]